MIKRSLMLVLALGGLCATQMFADTFIGGIENSLPGSSEGIGDFNDMIFSLSGNGLQLTDLGGGSWTPIGTANLQHANNLGGTSTASPFWDNLSVDDTVGSPKNIGYCLNTVSTTNNCSLASGAGTTSPAVDRFLSVNGATDNSFYFTVTGDQPVAVHLASIAANASNEQLSWYDPLDFTKFGTVFSAGSANGTTFTFTLPSGVTTFGLSFGLINTGQSFVTQNALGSAPADSRFAMFEVPDASGVPEPGTMALFGLGTVLLGLIPRLRKRR